MACPGIWAYSLGDLLVIEAVSAGYPHREWRQAGTLDAYTTLMVWFAWLYPNLRTRLVYAAGFLVFGIALEFAQSLTDYRTFELADMAADTVGVALGWIAALPPLPNLLVLTERRLSQIDAFLWDSRR
jgi:VanZ family protein